MNSEHPVAELSVILITPDSYETIRRTVHCLRSQSIKNRMELVIVAPSTNALQIDPSELREFLQYRIVETGKIRSIGSAYAEGIRQASAPIVALGEDHSYPQPGWAEGLLSAHRQPWAAVGPVMDNANPKGAISWADFLISYSPWMKVTSNGSIGFLPGHNSSYKRATLLNYGARLDDLMEAECLLHWDLCAKGNELCLEPSAKTFHTNFGLASSLILANYYSGRQFSASRAENQSWTLSRRLFYTAASPMIPPVRFWRILKDMRRLKNEKLPRISIFASLIAGLIADGIGQLIGYTLGAGNATSKLVELEFHRDRHQKKT